MRGRCNELHEINNNTNSPTNVKHKKLFASQFFRFRCTARIAGAELVDPSRAISDSLYLMNCSVAQNANRLSSSNSSSSNTDVNYRVFFFAYLIENSGKCKHFQL